MVVVLQMRAVEAAFLLSGHTASLHGSPASGRLMAVPQAVVVLVFRLPFIPTLYTTKV
ncbi:hypothetical protein KTT_05240 [Tengunoibacter tsumagoiensis]|uniref:Uncharacterized protein n=1 Tax=Tengunoibacter tsumagoiensis TaxID=2014871 RepID=A0A401ZUR1_9CHLR|nr:hypothetical protein KTT_05240 [Tengunoibacter tsumagoiensis]